MDCFRRAATIAAVVAGLGLTVPVSTAVAAPAAGINSVQETRTFTGDGRGLTWEEAERIALGRAHRNAADAGFPKTGCVVVRVRSIPLNGLWYATATVECTR